MSTVLVVDDKEMMRDSVGETLARAGFTVASASNGPAALQQIAKKRPDAIVSDMRMPGMTGIQLVEAVREIDEDIPVVVMTAFGTIDTAVEAIRAGAFDYITKPFEGDELVIAIKRAMQHTSLKRENQVLKATATRARPVSGERIGTDRLVGDGPSMRRVKEQIAAVAASSGTVMVCGESGTGKEVVARAIHELSPRASGPFLAVNCAALSESLLESELFGHEKGAFTGADKMRKGRFELADGGTLLLDEISEITPGLQAKLLRVLQERSFERVGSSRPLFVDVRVIATSNRDLPRAVASGDFRQDLFFRLNVLPVHLPPLRERPEDVAALARYLVEQVREREGSKPVRIHPHAEAILRRYAWPGNVRELQNICERAVVLVGSRLGDASADPDGTRVVTPELIEPWLIPGGEFRSNSVPMARFDAGLEHGNGMSMAGYAPNGRAVHVNGFGNGNGHTSGPVVGRAIPLGSSTGSTHPGGNGSAHGSDGVVGFEVDGPSGVRSESLSGFAAMTNPSGFPHVPSDMSMAEIEREVIVATLRRFDGHRQKTARALGIGVRTLGLKLRKWKDENLVASSL